MIKIKPPVGPDETLIMIYGDDSKIFVVTKSNRGDSLDVYSIDEIIFRDSQMSGYVIYTDVNKNIRIRAINYSEEDIWKFIENPELHIDIIRKI